MSKVFVVDANRTPLSPCSPRRARLLLRRGKAAVLRRYPFTIILRREVIDPRPQPLRLKIDPGSKVTGLALVNDQTGEVLFAAEIEHRGQHIKEALDARRAVRRNRRQRKTRYREPRFSNRRRREGWLPPSLESRVANITTWVARLRRYSAVAALSQELVRFDTQLMQDAEISGLQYQQGELAGYECREYLLEKFDRRCAYCDAKDIPLEVEHIVPRSRGGSNRVSNLAIACHACNQEKGDRTACEFGHPEVQALAKTPLRDAAAVNSTRWALYRRLRSTGLPVEAGTGGRTKFNRTRLGLPKTHWTDAASVGESTPDRLNIEGVVPLLIKAAGHGSRQACNVDRFGFPRGRAKASRRVKGFRTGDMVRAVVGRGKKAGRYVGRVAVRAGGIFKLRTKGGVVDGIGHCWCRTIHASDGYFY